MVRFPLSARLRAAVKPLVFRAASHPARLARRLRQIASQGVSTVLNLHRVAPDDRSAYPPLDPSLFAELLDFSQAHFHVVPLAGLEEKSSRPRLVLSFDDGYRDFVDHALPAMQRRGIVANQNVVVSCLESGLPPLSVLIQDFVGQAPPELAARLDVPGFTPRDPGNLAAELSDFARFQPWESQERLLEALLPQMRSWEGFRPTPMMSADDVIAAKDFVEFGAHSWAHASMAYESDAYFRQDLARCRDYFARHLGLPMAIYAFPNGSCRPEQLDAAFAEGLRHVLLVGEDFSRDPRVHGRFTFVGNSRAEVRFRALGGFCRP